MTETELECPNCKGDERPMWCELCGGCGWVSHAKIVAWQTMQEAREVFDPPFARITKGRIVSFTTPPYYRHVACDGNGCPTCDWRGEAPVDPSREPESYTVPGEHRLTRRGRERLASMGARVGNRLEPDADFSFEKMNEALRRMTESAFALPPDFLGVPKPPSASDTLELVARDVHLRLRAGTLKITDGDA